MPILMQQIDINLFCKEAITMKSQMTLSGLPWRNRADTTWFGRKVRSWVLSSSIERAEVLDVVLPERVTSDVGCGQALAGVRIRVRGYRLAL
jgi:hypothetical protein